MFLVGGVDSPITPGIIKGLFLAASAYPILESRLRRARRDRFPLTAMVLSSPKVHGCSFLKTTIMLVRVVQKFMLKSRGTFDLRSIPPSTHERLAGTPIKPGVPTFRRHSRLTE